MNRKFEIEKSELQAYLDMHLTYSEIAEKYGCSMWTVMERAKEYGLKSYARKYQMICNNPTADAEVRKKISDTIAGMWENGAYSDRVNGMAGLVGELYPNYRPEGAKTSYREKAKFYHPEGICLCCGKQLNWDDDSIEVHHVDEDHENYLLTNLMPLCHSCHRKYHRKSQPIVTISKSFVFDAAHYLPYHDRRCKFLHGHTYHLEVAVKGRVLQETGMVMDFGKLKQIVEHDVLDDFDHGFLNNTIEYPTCELMITWMWAKLSKNIKGLYRIKLYETDGSFCELTGGTSKWYLSQFESDWTRDTAKQESEGNVATYERDEDE